jgi:type IV secretion system protein VirD4
MLNTQDEEIRAFMGRHMDNITLPEFEAFMSQDKKLLTSIIATGRAALDLWFTDEVIQLTNDDNIHIEDLRNKKTVIYLTVPENKAKLYSIILNLFYTDCFEYTMSHTEGQPVYFLLDEFANLGKIYDFPTTITTLRKRRASVVLVLQELAQLKAIYGQEEAQAIYGGGINHKLYFSGLDYSTAKYG